MKKLLRTLTIAAALVVGLTATTATAAETVLAEADFSTLTSGSEESPELISSYTGYLPAPFADWKGSRNTSGLAGASGVYIADGGTLTSPRLSNYSFSGGGIKVTVVAKLNKAEMGMINIKQGYSTAQSHEVYSSDWVTVEAYFAASSNTIEIAPFLVADGIFVKYVKIAQSPDFVMPPTPYQPTDANGTSFTATWRAATGATKYYIDVYSYNEAGEKVYFVQNKDCGASRNAKIEGLDPNTTYYFVVRAATETGVSPDSEEVEVVKVVSALTAPVVKIASCDEAGNFRATWEPVADADDYSVLVVRKQTLTEATESNVLTEDFNVFTAGTLSSVEYIYERHLEALNEPGWTGQGMACINGAIGLDPFGDSSTLTTPALDLSADGGKIKVVINMAQNRYGTLTTGGVIKFSVVGADDSESEPVSVTIDKAEFAEYTVNLTGGTNTSKIKITSDDKIFIDNIEIKQVLPAGAVTSSTVLKGDTKSCEFSGKVEFADNVEYNIFVVANGRTVSAGEIVGLSSEPSEAVAITASSGIGAVEAGEDIIIANNGRGTVSVTTPAAVTVDIFDLAGRCIVSAAVPEGTSTIDVPATGIVIVKAGAKVAKIVL